MEEEKDEGKKKIHKGFASPTESFSMKIANNKSLLSSPSKIPSSSSPSKMPSSSSPSSKIPSSSSSPSKIPSSSSSPSSKIPSSSSPSKVLSTITKQSKKPSSSPSPTKVLNSPNRTIMNNTNKNNNNTPSPSRSIASTSSSSKKNKNKSPSRIPISTNKPSNLSLHLDSISSNGSLLNVVKDNDNTDVDFSIYFDNIPNTDTIVNNNEESSISLLNKYIENHQENEDNNNNNNNNNNNKVHMVASDSENTSSSSKKENTDISKKKTVFERLSNTSIHHEHHHPDLSISSNNNNSHNHNDHNNDHNHTHTTDSLSTHDSRLLFERLATTPIHNLTQRELERDFSPSSQKVTNKKRITHSSLNLNSQRRIKGLTPEKHNVSSKVTHAVVLVTKVPNLVDEVSDVAMKSRLTSVLSERECNLIASAMLKDTISTVSKLKDHDHAGNKLIVAIPDMPNQIQSMNIMLEKLKVKNLWSILTIPNDTPSFDNNNDDNVLTGNLTELLKYSLVMLGPCLSGSISFIASDCPTLQCSEIMSGQAAAYEDNCFYISPAVDGGYCLLSVPADTPTEIFDNIEWSNNDTCIQQIIALRKVASQSPHKKKQSVIVGRTHRDIDTVEDLKYLKQIIKSNENTDFTKEFPRTVSCLNNLSLE